MVPLSGSSFRLEPPSCLSCAAAPAKKPSRLSFEIERRFGRHIIDFGFGGGFANCPFGRIVSDNGSLVWGKRCMAGSVIAGHKHLTVGSCPCTCCCLHKKAKCNFFSCWEMPSCALISPSYGVID